MARVTSECGSAQPVADAKPIIANSLKEFKGNLCAIRGKERSPPFAKTDVAEKLTELATLLVYHFGCFFE